MFYFSSVLIKTGFFSNLTSTIHDMNIVHFYELFSIYGTIVNDSYDDESSVDYCTLQIANATRFWFLILRFIKNFCNFMPFLMSFAGTWQTGAPSFYDPNHIFVYTNPLFMSITLMQTNKKKWKLYACIRSSEWQSRVTRNTISCRMCSIK